MAKQLKKEVSNRACLLRVGVDEDDAQDMEAAFFISLKNSSMFPQ